MGIEDMEHGESRDGSLAKRMKNELLSQLWLGFPLIGINLVLYGRQVLSVMFVGHLGELELASASIASSICAVTGYSLLLGLATALETLCGQAYGARQYHLLGIYMQRATVILVIVCLPIAVLWWNMEKVLLMFGQDPAIAFNAGIYTQWMIPGLFAIAFLQPVIKYLQGQSKVLPTFYCSAATLALHGLLCWFFIFKLGWGNVGAALTVSISYWLNYIFLLLLVILTPSCKECWNGFSIEAFKGHIEFLKLAIPSAVMVCLEWWSFEALVILSGLLPNPKLEASVFSIILNTVSLGFMVPLGIGAAASTRVSNELGAGQPAKACFAFNVSMVLFVIDAVVIAAVFLLFRNVLGAMYSNESDVITYVAELAPYLAAISVMDALQGVISGVARGCGWQSTAAYVNLGAYYVVGMPLSYVLAFHFGMRGRGLLIGILCGVSVQAFCFAAITVLTNWTKMSEEAIKRIDSSASAAHTAPLLG